MVANLISLSLYVIKYEFIAAILAVISLLSIRISGTSLGFTPVGAKSLETEYSSSSSVTRLSKSK